MSEAPSATDKVKVILVTDEHLLVGVVPTRGQRLLDNLVDPQTSFLHIHNVHVCRLAAMSECVSMLDRAVVVKAKLSLAILVDSHQEAANRYFHTFARKRTYSAFLVVSGFDVHGQMHCNGPSDPVAILSNEMGAFMPVTQAIVSCYGREPITADVVLVNKARTSLLQVGENRWSPAVA